jgi:hypothetical protein
MSISCFQRLVSRCEDYLVMYQDTQDEERRKVLLLLAVQCFLAAERVLGRL